MQTRHVCAICIMSFRRFLASANKTHEGKICHMLVIKAATARNYFFLSGESHSTQTGVLLAKSIIKPS